ncbi:MAG: TrkH family potassium uptake protein [Bacteroidia bacterium]
MFNLRAIVNILGLLVAISGLAMLLSIPFALYYGSDDWRAILISGLGALALGATTWGLSYRRHELEMKKRDGYLVVTLGWLVMSFIGAAPYVLSGAIPNFTDAFFETMAGFSTTGATILGQEVEALPQGLHFWRAMTHWIGGMGIIVLTIAILPLLGIGGMQLYAAEVPGPTPDKLTPRIKETAKRLWIIYVALTLVEAVLLMLGGMNLYEALCHAMSTLSTGGFSTRQGSIGAFSPYIQYVVTVFMFLAGTNFALTYFALRGKPLRLWENEEFRIYTYSCLVLVLVVSVVVYRHGGATVEEAFRAAAFQVMAIITTTGFGTADYTAWGAFATVLFLVIMFCGACAGSTSGGMKLVRVIVVVKNSYLELKRQIHPKAIMPVRFNGKSIQQDVVARILAFFIIYVSIFVASCFVMAAMGLDVLTAIGSVAATLGNIGPGIGAVGPGDPQNFAAIPDAGKWFLSFLMLLGRLELFTVLMLLTPFFWREK